MRLTIVLLLCFCAGSVCAQLFTEVSSELGINYVYSGGSYGGGVSFFDADHNGWDDITFCTNQNGVVFYQNFNGLFAPPVTIVSVQGQVKQAIWIDYDNDGDSDLFVTRRFDKWLLYENTGSVLNLTDVTEAAGLGTDIFPQAGGSCWADIDNDGYIDVYIPNYDFAEGTPKNFLYHNNGDGTFCDISEISGADDGNNPSFQGLFFDYDHNGTQDLFVANDRTPHSNSFFKNSGGTFEDKTEVAALDHYIFSMNASISDIDHDGEYELYVSNNPTGNLMLRYNVFLEQYQDISSVTGTSVYDHSWSANWLDADNDTWEDLHVAVSPFWGQPGQDQFFFNNGDDTFTMDILSTGFSGDASSSYSSAIGDYNNDGFSDLVVLNGQPQESNVYRNNGNDNHYLKVELQGVNCNRDAFGARIEVYVDGELLIRTHHGGECYMSQNSQNEIFGLGPHEVVDSLSVIWPGGFTETAYNINADRKIKITEGEISDIYAQILGQISFNADNLCISDSIFLEASNDGPVMWNNQVFANSQWITEPGTYSYSFMILDQIQYSETLEVVGSTEFELELLVTDVDCFGLDNGAISFELLSTEEVSHYLLNDSLNAEMQNLPAGWYELSVHSENGCQTNQTILIFEPDELIASFMVTEALCFPEEPTVSTTFSGGTEPYTLFWDGFDPDSPLPGTYTPTIEDLNGCSVNETIEIEIPTPLLLNLETTPSTDGNNGSITCTLEGGTGSYTFAWEGPDNFSSEEQNIENLSPGIYTLIAFDTNDCWVVSSEHLTATSIDEITSSLALYPNPARDHVTVEFNEKITAIDLFDVNGRLLFVQKIDVLNERVLINLEAYSKGIVFLTIHTEQQRISKILVLE